MTDTQQELREERIAIMVESGTPEDVAVAFCNRHPELYGIVDREEKQAQLLQTLS